jgi:GNAT superfamily N-acetyltransferase
MRNLPMYNKLVQTEEELAAYNFIWKSVFKEKGFELEDYNGKNPIERYLILNNFNQFPEFIGTVEYVKYDPKQGTNVEDLFPFSSVPEVRMNLGNIAEIDKVAILKEHRGKGAFEKILYTNAQYAEKHGIKYFIALLEIMLYRSLGPMYHIPVKKVGEVILKDSYQVVPVLIDMEWILNNVETHYPWYIKMVANTLSHE